MAGVSEPPPPYPPPPGDSYSPPPFPPPYSPPVEQPFLESADQPYPRPPTSGVYDPYSQQPAPATSGFAIASLVLGILGPCGLGVGLILAIIFGFIALSQTKNGRQQGRGMAIAGLICSGLWIVALVVGLVLFILFAENQVSARDLKVGDCVETAPADGDENISTMPKVSCDKPHESEVFAILNIPGDRFPGTSVLRSQYRKQCYDALQNYAKDPAGMLTYTITPAQESWDQGNHSVVCMTLDRNKRTGSVKK
jgi:hypothetical protein